MTTREYLESIQVMDIEIEQLQEEIKELRERSFAISGTNFDAPERGKGSFTTNAPFAAVINRMVDLEMLLCKKIEKLALRKRKIIGRIHKIGDPLFIRLLFKRYVEFKPLLTIAEELSYDYGYLRRLHGDAITAFENVRIKIKKRSNTK